MSTAVERIMRERGDLNCFHEPFIYYYYLCLGVKSLPHFDIDTTQPSNFGEIVEHLKKHATTNPIFFKDMSYYVVPEIFQHNELSKLITHMFLIRDPRKSILSYHKLDSEIRCDEVGIEAQWRHVEWIQATAGITPIVVEAETIQYNPQKTMNTLWGKLNLPFVHQAFKWQTDETPQDWKQVAGWHQSVSTSTGINETQQESDMQIQSKFDEIAKTAPQLKKYLKHHWPYYQRLKEIAITPSE